MAPPACPLRGPPRRRRARRPLRLRLTHGSSRLPRPSHPPRQKGATIRFNLTVNLDPAAFGLPGPGIEAIDFDVRADSVEAALDLAFAVCNSHPGELGCPQEYAEVVAAYRDMRFRSLSVGDRVRVRAEGVDRTFRRAASGWEACDIPRDAPESGEPAAPKGTPS